MIIFYFCKYTTNNSKGKCVILLFLKALLIILSKIERHIIVKKLKLFVKTVNQ